MKKGEVYQAPLLGLTTVVRMVLRREKYRDGQLEADLSRKEAVILYPRRKQKRSRLRWLQRQLRKLVYRKEQVRSQMLVSR